MVSNSKSGGKDRERRHKRRDIWLISPISGLLNNSPRGERKRSVVSRSETLAERSSRGFYNQPRHRGSIYNRITSVIGTMYSYFWMSFWIFLVSLVWFQNRLYPGFKIFEEFTRLGLIDYFFVSFGICVFLNLLRRSFNLEFNCRTGSKISWLFFSFLYLWIYFRTG